MNGHVLLFDISYREFIHSVYSDMNCRKNVYTLIRKLRLSDYIQCIIIILFLLLNLFFQIQLDTSITRMRGICASDIELTLGFCQIHFVIGERFANVTLHRKKTCRLELWAVNFESLTLLCSSVRNLSKTSNGSDFTPSNWSLNRRFPHPASRFKNQYKKK